MKINLEFDSDEELFTFCRRFVKEINSEPIKSFPTDFSALLKEKYPQYSTRIENALAHMNINTLDKLIALSERQLIWCPGLGGTSLFVIKEILARMNLELNDDNCKDFDHRSGGYSL